jgi:hypothetical protein
VPLLVLALLLGLPAPATALRHHQCYDSRTSTTFATVPGVTLADRFGALTVDVRRPEYQCAPADVDGGDPTAPADPIHLVAHAIRQSGTRFERVRDQRVTNQFHDVRLDVVKPVRLLVPSTVSLAGPPSSPPGTAVRHFTCYKVRRTAGAPQAEPIVGVAVDTVFEGGAGPVAIDLAKPKRLCAPTDKNGEDPGAPGDPDHLLCYRTRSSGSFGEYPVFLLNQFGPQTYTIRGSRRELCVPSSAIPS